MTSLPIAPVPAAVLGLLLLALIARVQGQEGSGIPMPISVSEAWAQEACVSVHNVPFGDRELEYEVGVPRSWTDATPKPPASESIEAPVLLGLWREEGKAGAEIAVSYVVLPYDMPAEAWMEGAAKALGLEVVRRRWGKLGGRPLADFLARGANPNGTRIARMAGMVDADRLFLVTGGAVESDYAAYAERFAAAILSFRLVHPVTTSEPDLVDYRIEKPFPVRAALPRGWKVEVAHGLQPQYGLAYARPPAEAGQFALIRLQLAAAAAGWEEDAALARAIEAPRDTGFAPAATVLAVPVARPGLPRGKLTILRGRDREREMELRVFTFPSPEGRLTVSSLCPSRTVSREDWRACRNAMDALIRQLSFGSAPPAKTKPSILGDALQSFLGANYHQDVWLDYDSDEEIWDEFRACPREHVLEVVREIDELLARPPEEWFPVLERCADGIGFANAEEAADWLRECRNYLARP